MNDITAGLKKSAFCIDFLREKYYNINVKLFLKGRYNMKTKRITAAVSALLAAAMLAGCGNNAEKTPETTEETDFTAEVTSAASAETDSAVNEDNSQTKEESEVPTVTAEENGSASSGGQSSSEGQQNGNSLDEQQNNGLVTEKPVEFTEADIEAIRGIFDPPDGIYRLLFADTPFDLSQDITDLNRLLEFVYNWKRVVLTDIQADDSYSEYNELMGDTTFNLFKPETIESAIKEKLLPEFDISRYSPDENTPFWDEEKQMFDSIDMFFPEGYPGHIYDIVSDGQEGNYYCITVIDFDISLYVSAAAAELAGNYAGMQHQKYTFRKLPNGNIAPLKMELTQPEEWEINAAEISAKILEICEDNAKSKKINIDHYYLDDIDNDGTLDLIADGNEKMNPSPETFLIYHSLDVNNCTKYDGVLYRSETTGDIWQRFYLDAGRKIYDEYTNLTTGDKYKVDMVSVPGGGDLILYKINNIEVDYNEYNAILSGSGALEQSDAGFKYDITDHLTDSNRDPFSFLKMIHFCKDNLN